jgi:hypothetical protein
MNLTLSREPKTSDIFRPLVLPSLYGTVLFFVALSVFPFFRPPTSVTEIAIDRDIRDLRLVRRLDLPWTLLQYPSRPNPFEGV